MRIFEKLNIGFKALTQLDIRQLCFLLVYKSALHLGFFRFITPQKSARLPLKLECLTPNWFFNLPQREKFLALGADYLKRTRSYADEIVDGRIRFFGGITQPLQLEPEGRIAHWSIHEKGMHRSEQDIKFVWEPARFNWAIWLAKAFYLCDDEKYAASFFANWEVFSKQNALNSGPNWQSGQEIALRLISLVICLHFFRGSGALTQDQIDQVILSIAQHAERIPATVIYAKAQNNNHLISEAVGLYCAGVFLPFHPKAGKWKKLGLKWFNQAILSQIDDSGEYIQHSTNYHRMMLISSLWMQILMNSEGGKFSAPVFSKLALATGWLVGHLDELSGRTPNLGHNDGSFILPFTICEFSDHRPVIQAASRSFLSRQAIDPGIWDDLSIWLGQEKSTASLPNCSLQSYQSFHRIGSRENWASIRATHFINRPAHADQLHVEIWHQGINLARDAGTYQYNALPPWENSLSGTQVHNTITLDHQDQMLRAGRFLWLDWAQASLIEENASSITVSHNGYQNMGVIHQRKLKKCGDYAWLVTDQLISCRTTPKIRESIRLHWLIGDWPYELQNNKLVFSAPFGKFSLEIWSDPIVSGSETNIIRAGVSHTQPDTPASSILGWWSPTYGVKEPALSILFSIPWAIPLVIYSKFTVNI